MFQSIHDLAAKRRALTGGGRRTRLGFIAIAVAALAFPATALAFGTFGSVKTSHTGGVVYGLAISDMNGDGKADIVAGNDSSTNVPSGHISLLLGKGNGSFKRQIKIADSKGPEGIAIGNFNGDKHKDFAVGNYNNGGSASSVEIFLGRRTGGFKDAATIPVTPGAWLVKATDLNRDGKTDLVVGNFDSTGPDAVAVLLGNGNGTFSGPHYYASSGGLYGLAVGRMNGDKRPDVVTEDGSDNVCVLLTHPNGSLAAPKCKVPVGASGSYNGLTLGDFNGDGKLDAAVTNTNNGGSGEQVLTMLGNGDGTLQDSIPTSTGALGLWAIGSGDFNRDGKLDVVVGNRNSPVGVGLLLGKGNGKFKAPKPYAGSDGPEAIVPGKINSDKGLDLAVGTDSGVDVFVNQR